MVRSTNCNINHNREALTMGMNDINSSSHGKWNCKYRNREFWCRCSYVDTVGKNKKRIAGYIQS